MKVNEVITEAPVGTNRFSRFLSKTFGAGRGDSVAADAIDQWAEYAKTLERAGTDLTTANYNQHLNQWLGKWMKLGKPYPGKLTDFTGPGVNDYIARAVAQAKTGNIPSTEEPVAASPEKPEQPSPTASVAPGVKIINPEPPIIQFRGKDYVLDDLGDWISLESGKVLPQSFKNFLDQQLEITQGLEPGATKRT